MDLKVECMLHLEVHELSPLCSRWREDVLLGYLREGSSADEALWRYTLAWESAVTEALAEGRSEG